VRDSLQWSLRLEEPELEQIRADFLSRNRAEGNPQVFYTLNYVADGQIIGEDLWLLMWPVNGTGARLIVVGPDARVARRIELPEARGVRVFTVDIRQRMLYLVGSDDATLVRTSLPTSLMPP
jgi:hypothetical protein